MEGKPGEQKVMKTDRKEGNCKGRREGYAERKGKKRLMIEKAKRKRK